MPRKWTIEEDKIITKMWVKEKASATVIAATLGATRSSILGKVRRMKLPNEGHANNFCKGPRKVYVRPKQPTPPRPMKIKNPIYVFGNWDKEPEAPSLAVEVVNIPPPGPETNVLMLNSGPKHCKEIVSEWGPAVYCGAPQKEGSSFCPYHYAINHEGKPSRRRVG